MTRPAPYPARTRRPGYARRHALYPFAWRTPVLLVPGLHDSGPDHWQTHWEHAHVGITRVRQRDFAQPDLDAWARHIVETAAGLDAPPVVVAHSFGCLATVRAVLGHDAMIAGALLVAPADPARFGIPLALLDELIPAPSTLVASTNDPWLKLTKAGALAVTWGSRLVTLGAAGHVNADSGHRSWPEGLALLRDLAERAAAAGTTQPSRPRTHAEASARKALAALHSAA